VPARTLLDPSKKHQRLKQNLSPKLAQIRYLPRRLRARFPIALGVTVLIAVPVAVPLYDLEEKLVSWMPPMPLSVLGTMIGGLLLILLGGVGLARRKRWQLAGLPLARVYAGEGLAVGCQSCESEIRPRRSMVARCDDCGAENLVPAPLVPRRQRHKYKEVIQRRLETASPAAARSVARTILSELAGWFTLGIGAFATASWFAWGENRFSYTNPLWRLAVPALLALGLGTLAVRSILSARWQRWQLRRKGGLARRRTVRLG
jgi:hypothetical protein